MMMMRRFDLGFSMTLLSSHPFAWVILCDVGGKKAAGSCLVFYSTPEPV
jgi:hypothetical protein